MPAADSQSPVDTFLAVKVVVVRMSSDDHVVPQSLLLRPQASSYYPDHGVVQSP